MLFKIISNSFTLKVGRAMTDVATDDVSLKSEGAIAKLLEFRSEMVFSSSVSFLILVARLSYLSYSLKMLSCIGSTILWDFILSS